MMQRPKFFLKIFILALIIFVINIVIILQLIPVFESSTLGAKIVNLIVSPPNFIFEDLLGISSVKIIDVLTWVLQFVYCYLIAFLLIKLLKRK
ncbi:MAG: hypothetical protein Q7S27_05740 [Nanoarchaeota archaeon]|nr:hypothetical protein [Nanoarchaeota archaeon]